MSDTPENTGVITEYSSSLYEGSTSDEDRATILANAMGAKQEAASETAANSEESTTEEADIEEAVPKQEEDQFASKFAALSRKEKAVREREAQIEARLKELEEKSTSLESEYEEKYGKYKSLPDRLKNQPLEVLAEEGVDLDTLLKMVLENDGKPTTEMQIQRLREDMKNNYSKELENLKQELAEKEKAAEAKRQEEVVEDYKYELNEFINSNTDEFELIKLNEASDLVYQVVEDHYNENGRILTHKEACEHVENYLLEEAKKHLSVNKIKKLLNPEDAPSKPQAEQQVGAKTLSNTAATTVPNESSRVLSDEESKRRAAELIRWEE
jgi:hypothetical protein